MQEDVSSTPWSALVGLWSMLEAAALAHTRMSSPGRPCIAPALLCFPWTFSLDALNQTSLATSAGVPGQSIHTQGSDLSRRFL